MMQLINAYLLLVAQYQAHKTPEVQNVNLVPKRPNKVPPIVEPPELPPEKPDIPPPVKEPPSTPPSS